MNHYDVLGLIPSVEQPVIRAAYKALVNIYHPDKYPAKDTEEIIKKINIAYEILSNPKKKKDYDKEIEISKKSANKFSFSTEASFDTGLLDDKWSLAIDFYPSILEEYNFLKQISWNLAYSFKLDLIESKDYSNSSKLFLNKKFNYLSLYFGSDSEVLDYAEKLILIKEIDAALKLNSMVRTMGKSVSKQQLESAIDKQYPMINGKVAFFTLKAGLGLLENLHARNTLLKIHEAKLSYSGFFLQKTILSMNGQKNEFKDEISLRNFLLKKLSSIYE